MSIAPQGMSAIKSIKKIKALKMAKRKRATKTRAKRSTAIAPAPRAASAPPASRRYQAVRQVVVRRVSAAGKRAGDVGKSLAIAQARILPSAMGGYIAAKIERHQRIATADLVSGKGRKPVIADPTLRIAAMMAALAFAASKTDGMVREAVIGAAGGLGAIYEIYSDQSDSNPADDYSDGVKKALSAIGKK